MDAAISVICFKSKTLANGEHPLMLRITKDRKRTMKNLCRRKRQKRLSQITNNKVLIPYEPLLHENFVLWNFATGSYEKSVIYWK